MDEVTDHKIIKTKTVSSSFSTNTHYYLKMTILIEWTGEERNPMINQFENKCLVDNEVESSMKEELGKSFMNSGWFYTHYDKYVPGCVITGITISPHIHKKLLIWSDGFHHNWWKEWAPVYHIDLSYITYKPSSFYFFLRDNTPSILLFLPDLFHRNPKRLYRSESF